MPRILEPNVLQAGGGPDLVLCQLDLIVNYNAFDATNHVSKPL
jgi:hypothetical protein